MIRGPIDGLMCDMDGVLYRGTESIPGATEAVQRLRDRGTRIVFCTNNSSATVEDYVAKLDRMGIQARAEEVLTSAVVTANVLKERGGIRSRALVVGGTGLRASLESVGVAIVDDPDVAAVDMVVVGLDISFDYAALRRAADAVRAGAILVATNDDATLPMVGGLWPGAGSILAGIEKAAGRRAEVMGKPHPPMMDAVAARLAGAAHIAAVGDRPETDLAGASRRGWTTVLVLSGVTSAADARRIDPQPDLILDSIADLPGRS
jgi:4-nitrophenyl phosphatase